MTLSPLHKALCSVLLATAPFIALQARNLSPEEALNRLQTPEMQKRIAGGHSLSLSHIETLDNVNYVYVFNKESNGFLVISADDRMPALLGYSDSGSFDAETASPALKWWLNMYAEEASSTFSKDTAITSDNIHLTRSESDREKIPALIETKWDQNAPFNDRCPILNGHECVTGCVATAMAQIIKYHNYPSSGNDMNEYLWTNARTPLSYDFSTANFKYELMPDIYNGSQSEEEIEQVAQLMYACGVSVNMNYNVSSQYDPFSKGSSASDSYIAYALRHYFKYDNGVKLMKKEFFTAEQWEELIYSELQQRRPVLYGGQAPRGGHQFICDGYDGDGYFHINWGWSGHGDGEFKLTALDPSFQGVGGFSGGYNAGQTAVVGIQPPLEGSEIWYPIYSDGSLCVTGLRNNNCVTLSYSGGGIWNFSQEPVDVEILIEAVGSDAGIYISKPYPFRLIGETEPRATYPFLGAEGLNISGYSPSPLYLPENLPTGDYKCRLVIKTPEGNIQRIYFPAMCVSYFNLNIASDGKASISEGQPETTPDIRVIKCVPRDEVIQNELTRLDLTIENKGDAEYPLKIYYRIFKDGEPADNSIIYTPTLAILPGETETFTIVNGRGFSLDPGTYDFIFFDILGKQISDPFPITIGKSGVEAIIGETSSADIYTSGGILIRKKADKDYINELPKGIYIIKTAEGESKKIVK